MLTVGILGCGKSSQNYHLPVVEALDGIELSWVCDLDAERARDTGREYGVRAYDDTDDAIADTPDIVHVNTPPFTHRDLTVDALEAGAHVLVEKPMAMTVEECEEMADAADREGKKLCVVHNNLFFDPMLAVKRGVEAGEYGDVVAVRSFLGGQPNPGDKRDWTADSHGGPIGDRLPHPVYLSTHFLDDVQDASVEATETPAGDLNGVSVQMADGGAFGNVMASERVLPAKTAAVFGTKKIGYVDLFNYTAVEYDTVDRSPASIVLDNVGAAGQIAADTAKNVVGYASDLRGEGSKFAAPGHYNLIDAFRTSILRDDPVPVPPEEGIKSVRVLDQIDEARGENEREAPATAD